MRYPYNFFFVLVVLASPFQHASAVVLDKRVPQDTNMDSQMAFHQRFSEDASKTRDSDVYHPIGLQPFDEMEAPSVIPDATSFDSSNIHDLDSGFIDSYLDYSQPSPPDMTSDSLNDLPDDDDSTVAKSSPWTDCRDKSDNPSNACPVNPHPSFPPHPLDPNHNKNEDENPCNKYSTLSMTIHVSCGGPTVDARGYHALFAFNCVPGNFIILDLTIHCQRDNRRYA